MFKHFNENPSKLCYIMHYLLKHNRLHKLGIVIGDSGSLPQMFIITRTLALKVMKSIKWSHLTLKGPACCVFLVPPLLFVFF